MMDRFKDIVLIINNFRQYNQRRYLLTTANKEQLPVVLKILVFTFGLFQEVKNACWQKYQNNQLLWILLSINMVMLSINQATSTAATRVRNSSNIICFVYIKLQLLFMNNALLNKLIILMFFYAYI